MTNSYFSGGFSATEDQHLTSPAPGLGARVSKRAGPGDPARWEQSSYGSYGSGSYGYPYPLEGKPNSSKLGTCSNCHQFCYFFGSFALEGSSHVPQVQTLQAAKKKSSWRLGVCLCFGVLVVSQSLKQEPKRWTVGKSSYSKYWGIWMNSLFNYRWTGDTSCCSPFLGGDEDTHKCAMFLARGKTAISLPCLSCSDDYPLWLFEACSKLTLVYLECPSIAGVPTTKQWH